MLARFSSLVVWSLVAATLVAWVMQLGARGRQVPPHAVLASAAPAAGGDLSRLLGLPPVAVVAAPVAAEPAVPADARLRLLGVVAPRPGYTAGLALISVDGKPARAVAQGREVEPGGLRVLQVSHRKVELGPAMGQQPSVALELPLLPDAARGRPDEQLMVSPAQPGRPVSVPAVSLPPVMGAPGQPPAPVLAPAAVQALPQPMIQPAKQGTSAAFMQPAMADMPVQQDHVDGVDAEAQPVPTVSGSARMR